MMIKFNKEKFVYICTVVGAIVGGLSLILGTLSFFEVTYRTIQDIYTSETFKIVIFGLYVVLSLLSILYVFSIIFKHLYKFGEEHREMQRRIKFLENQPTIKRPLPGGIAEKAMKARTENKNQNEIT